MLTPSRTGCMRSTSCVCGVGRHGADHQARAQFTAIQALIQRRPQQTARIRETAGVVELLPREREQRCAAKYQASFGDSIDELGARVEPVTIASGGLEHAA